MPCKDEPLHDAPLRGDVLAAVLRGQLLPEVEAAALHGQRMVHNELHRHDGVHRGRVAALGRDRVTQTGQVH